MINMKSNFLKSIKWHLTVGKLFGLVHFRTIDNKHLSSSKILRFWSIALLLFVPYIIYQGLHRHAETFSNQSQNVIAKTDIIFSLYSALSLIFALIYQMVTSSDMMKLLLEIDTINVTINRNRTWSLTLCVMTIVSIATIDFVSLRNYYYYYVLMYSLNWYVGIVEQMLIYEILADITEKIKVLNEQLYELMVLQDRMAEEAVSNSNCKDRKWQLIFNNKFVKCYKKVQRNSMRIFTMHKKLHELAHRTNKMFGIRLVFIILMDLLITVYTLQYIYHVFRFNQYDELFSYVSWTIIANVGIILILQSWVGIVFQVSI